MSDRYRCSVDALARRVGAEVVVVDLGTDRIHALNSTGGRLWELLIDQQASTAEAIDRLMHEFDVSQETATAEVARFTDVLVGEGLVVADV